MITSFLWESKSSIAAKKAGLIYTGHGYWKNSRGHTVAQTVKGELIFLSGTDSRKQTALHLRRAITPKPQANLPETEIHGEGEWWLTKKQAHSTPLNMLYRRLFTDSQMTLDGAKKLSGPLGTNPGGIYSIPRYGGQEKVYVKFYKTINQCYTEAFANWMYNSDGSPDIGKIDSNIMTKGKKVAVGNMMVPGATTYKDVPQEQKKVYANKILDDFLLDVLLANWDVVGLEFDNILCRAGGIVKSTAQTPTDRNARVWRVDNGGALFYRAQGTPKTKENLENVTELDTFLDPRMNTYAQIFKDAGYSSLDQFKNRLLDQLNSLRLRQGQGEFSSIPLNNWGSGSPIGTEAARILESRFKKISAMVQDRWGYKGPAKARESEKAIWNTVQPDKDLLGLRFKTHPQERVIAKDMEKMDKQMMKIRMAPEDTKPWAMGRSVARSLQKSMGPEKYDALKARLYQWKDGDALAEPEFKKEVGNIIAENKVYCPMGVRKLERGMRIQKKDVREFLSNFKIGQSMSMPTAGFSADDVTAKKFMWPGVGRQVAQEASVLVRIVAPDKHPFVAGLLATHVVLPLGPNADPDWVDSDNRDWDIRTLPHPGENEVIRSEGATAKCLSIKKFIGKLDLDVGTRGDSSPADPELFVQYTIELEDEGYNKELVTEGVREIAKQIFNKYIGTPLAALRLKPPASPEKK
jgi:hypothetical protein